MPIKADQSSNWDYKVNQVKLFTPDGVFSGLYGNQREDTGEVLGSTSDRYGIIQNKDLMDVALEALSKQGMDDYEQRVFVTGGGARAFIEFTFKNKQLANSVGDIFGYRLIMQNSFNRTLRASVVLAFLRLTCLNGASTMENEFGVNQKHSTKITVDFVKKAIDKAVTRGPEALKIYDQMAAVNITDEQGVTILNNLMQAKLLSAKMVEEITTLWLAPKRQEDKARDLYRLLNAVTEHLTHKVEGERYEYANKVQNNVLFSLVNAARKPEKFTKLITPIPQNEKTIMVAEGPVIDVDIVQ